ncbi:MAG: YceI family protein [Thermoanaerobaculia bacterium]
MPRTVCAWIVAGALCPGAALAAGEMLVFHLDPDETAVEFRLGATLHTVEGSLGTASGRIAFDPESGLAAGEVVIDLTAAETGVERRDRKMHEQVLETERFPEAVYRVERIDVPDQSLELGRNDLQLHGTLEFHGATREVAVPTVATVEAGRVSATAWIEIPYVDWGLPDPSFFVLRVGKTVRVEIEASGRLEGELPAAGAEPSPGETPDEEARAADGGG